jgi:hypothetical protein
MVDTADPVRLTQRDWTAEGVVPFDKACERLEVNPCALVDLVARGLLRAYVRYPSLATARIFSQGLDRLSASSQEVAASRRAHVPYRTPEFERAMALGALLSLREG